MYVAGCPAREIVVAILMNVYRAKQDVSPTEFVAPTSVSYLLAKFQAVADKKIYYVNNYIISGHSLEHLCLALIPILLSVMLIYRELKFQRYSFIILNLTVFNYCIWRRLLTSHITYLLDWL